ncbi:MAG: DUF2059 domain-containing protein [Acidobacteria bacterium]|nr:DUF2059 domain-containing protein [Acidobacteriota bacterium]
MRRSLVIACLLALSTCSLWSQQSATAANQPPSSEQVMKFFDIMHLREQMQTMLQTEQKQVNIMVGDMFSKRMPDATPEQRKQFESLMSDMANDLFKNYPIDDLLRDMVPVYQNHLSEADLAAIVDFYSSPVGKKVLKEMPAMTAEAMRISYARMQPKIEDALKKMESRVDAMANDEKKSGTDSKPADPKK